MGKYNDIEKEYEFVTEQGTYVRMNTVKHADGHMSITVNIPSKSIEKARAWLTVENELRAFIGKTSVVIDAPANIFDAIVEDYHALTQFQIDKKNKFDELAQLAIVNDGSYMLDYSICKVIKAKVWESTPFADRKENYKYDQEDFYLQQIEELDYLSAGYSVGTFSDMLEEKYGVKNISGHLAFVPGNVYIIDYEIYKRIVKDLRVEKLTKELRKLEEERSNIEFDANKYGILPRAELKRLAKIYDDINNEGYKGGGFNPYRSCYVSQERYDSFMKSYNNDKASIEKELSELQY